MGWKMNSNRNNTDNVSLLRSSGGQTLHSQGFLFVLLMSETQDKISVFVAYPSRSKYFPVFESGINTLLHNVL